jgi:uncharacterized protein
MLVNIRQITEDGLDLDLRRSNWILEATGGSILVPSVQANVHLQWEEGQLHVYGKISAAAEIHCSRCSKEFSTTLGEDFDFMVLPSQHLKLPESQRLSAEELEVAFLRGDDLDLDEVIQENLFLSIPIQPLCSPSCQGLCSRCGKDLNEGECACPKGGRIDPRLRPLEKLREQMIPKAR